MNNFIKCRQQTDILSQMSQNISFFSCFQKSCYISYRKDIIMSTLYRMNILVIEIEKKKEYDYSKEYINVLCVKEIIIRPLNLFYCSRYERKFEQENKLSVNDNRPCFQVSLCVISLLSRELRMRRKWFDFRYHSR